ncbi:fluoride efflux transporter CrcB [Pseudanabaena sp. PCC 6802]|uniref:fluoride efflux transporter CrcB n=1 Tax=Pseudanabaena sp. PCC 6802 TaxID=118173 RepID=UPI00055A7652|nr:fluoride efflux transporter CrcB [Pseudanabaena sp. PCC 6802]
MSPDMRAPIAIALGAIPGALSRYYLTILLAKWLGTDFPYGTFVVNITGALIMGLFTTIAVERHLIPSDLSLLVATGFLGSYTTFSTYALDVSRLLHQGSYGYGLFYWIGSAMLGLVGLEIGSAIARRLL